MNWRATNTSTGYFNNLFRRVQQATVYTNLSKFINDYNSIFLVDWTIFKTYGLHTFVVWVGRNPEDNECWNKLRWVKKNPVPLNDSVIWFVFGVTLECYKWVAWYIWCKFWQKGARFVGSLENLHIIIFDTNNVNQHQTSH